MSWLTTIWKKKGPQQLHVQSPVFLGEQSGNIEQELKRRLIEFLRVDQSIVAAYLVRVSYKDILSPSVALCLRTQRDSQAGMAEHIGNVFESMFSSKEHMDIIFLNADQESKIRKICPPFFEAATDTSQI